MLVLAVIIGLFYIFGFSFIPDSLIYVVKIIPMLLLIIYAVRLPIAKSNYRTWLIIGLILCMVGDFTLQWFIIGLLFFLSGHIAYIIAFLSTANNSRPIWITLLITGHALLMIYFIAFAVYQRGDTILAIAIVGYISVILTMGLTAFRTGNSLAIRAALLFIISDSVLSIDRFIISLDMAHIIVMFTYYSAQLLFVLSLSRYSANRKK